MKRIIALITTAAICLSFAGCTSTKIKKDITTPAEVEKIDPSEYINLVIPDNLKELTGLTVGDLIANEDEAAEYAGELYYEDGKSEVQITDRAIKEGDKIHFFYACYANEKFQKNYSQLISFTAVVGEPSIGEDYYPTEMLTSIIGEIGKGVYEYHTEIEMTRINKETGEEETYMQPVRYEISVEYITEEEAYPSLREIYEAVDSAQIDYGIYEDYVEKMTYHATLRKKSEKFYEILQYIVNASTYTKDHSLLTRGQYKSMYYYAEALSNAYGISFLEYLISMGYTSVEDFEKQTQIKAEETIKQKIAYLAILQSKGLDYAHLDFNASVSTQADRLNFDTTQDCINLFGSDTLRFETIRLAYQDLIFNLGVEGYTDYLTEKIEKTTQPEETTEATTTTITEHTGGVIIQKGE